MKKFVASFITSVSDESKFYLTNRTMIAIAGKSNVGKSSVINMLAGNKKLARTSVTPGRTRLINYFDFETFILCDLPGYGFARVSKEEKEKWGLLLEKFLVNEKLSLVILLVDIRHAPTDDDVLMVNFLYHYQIPFVIVATKSDKIAKTKIKQNISLIASTLKVGLSDITACSSITGQGRDDIFSLIDKAIVVNGRKNK